MASGDRIFLKIYVWKYQVFIARMEWKSGISQIPRGMAEKRRKCGIIPPKVEWLACLLLASPSLSLTGGSTELIHIVKNETSRSTEMKLPPICDKLFAVATSSWGQESFWNGATAVANTWTDRWIKLVIWWIRIAYKWLFQPKSWIKDMQAGRQALIRNHDFAEDFAFFSSKRFSAAALASSCAAITMHHEAISVATTYVHCTGWAKDRTTFQRW